MSPPVYIVHLRRPDQKNPNEQRADPFFEFGSFGCTGCHSKNLLNPKTVSRIEGARLAFAQGGHNGFRLVLPSPPITLRRWEDITETRWKPTPKPFRYAAAPVLVANELMSDFPLLERFVSQTHRETIEGGFSSRFRSCCTPLPEAIAREMILHYDRRVAAARDDAFANVYADTMPYHPPTVDGNRRASYRTKIARLNGTSGKGSVRCTPRPRTAKRKRSC